MFDWNSTVPSGPSKIDGWSRGPCLKQVKIGPKLIFANAILA